MDRGMRTVSAAYTLVQDALMDLRSTREKIAEALASLPELTEDDLKDRDLEEPCPICLVPLSSILDEANAATKKDRTDGQGEKEDDSEDPSTSVLGVTKLVGCGHVFCRKDLTEWIQSQHGSCPTCRHAFLHIQPLALLESDDESSDGGEYIPNAEDFEDEDEDAFLDVDGFTDADADDFPVEPMDLDFDEIWEDATAEAFHEGGEDLHDGIREDTEMTDVGDDDYEYQERSSEWGLTDGESESMSSSEVGDLSLELNGVAAPTATALDREVSVSVHEDEDENVKEGEGLDVNANPSDLAASQPDKEGNRT